MGKSSKERLTICGLALTLILGASGCNNKSSEPETQGINNQIEDYKGGGNSYADTSSFNTSNNSNDGLGGYSLVKNMDDIIGTWRRKTQLADYSGGEQYTYHVDGEEVLRFNNDGTFKIEVLPDSAYIMTRLCGDTWPCRKSKGEYAIPKQGIIYIYNFIDGHGWELPSFNFFSCKIKENKLSLSESWPEFEKISD